jgi:septal ring factor EnvC (AmiA/AmiB activator)
VRRNSPLLAAAALCAASAAAAAPPSELDTLRQECIAAARDSSQRERQLAALEHTIELLTRDADARRRGLDESRAEQTHLLAALLHLARHQPGGPASAAAPPFDRVRGELLLDGAIPALRAEARALIGEIERVAQLRRRIAAKQDELAPAQALAAMAHEQLAALVARRNQLEPEDKTAAARIAKLAREAGDLGDLVKRADAADPARARPLPPFDPEQSALVMPVAGTISKRFGEGEAKGLSVAAVAGAEAVAPADGRVIYAGPYRNFGLVLIIRHGGLYHSLLAGLKRLDIAVDRVVGAGEPVGAMPETGAVLYVELRRDGRPVDPQPWLAPTEDGRDQPGGDQRMRE